MDLTKRYKDYDGNPCNILHLIKESPEWAANRIQVGEKAIARLKEIENSGAELVQFDTIVTQRILDAAIDLLRFTKHNDYPEFMSEGFNTLTNKIDILETELRRAGVIRGQLEAV